MTSVSISISTKTYGDFDYEKEVDLTLGQDEIDAVESLFAELIGRACKTLDIKPEVLLARVAGHPALPTQPVTGARHADPRPHATDGTPSPLKVLKGGLEQTQLAVAHKMGDIVELGQVYPGEPSEHLVIADIPLRYMTTQSFIPRYPASQNIFGGWIEVGNIKNEQLTASLQWSSTDSGRVAVLVGDHWYLVVPHLNISASSPTIAQRRLQEWWDGHGAEITAQGTIAVIKALSVAPTDQSPA